MTDGVLCSWSITVEVIRFAVGTLTYDVQTVNPHFKSRRPLLVTFTENMILIVD